MDNERNSQQVGETGGFTRKSGDNDRSGYSLAKAFRIAAEGIGYALRTQRNVRIDLCFAVIAVILGIVCGIDATQWAVIALCIGAVIGLECMNTAIEAVVDLVSPEYHILAKRAKDCAAGAVFVCALASVAVACFIYLPALCALAGF